MHFLSKRFIGSLTTSNESTQKSKEILRENYLMGAITAISYYPCTFEFLSFHLNSTNSMY